MPAISTFWQIAQDPALLKVSDPTYQQKPNKIMPTHHIIIDDLQAEIDRLKQENLDLRIANDRLTRTNAQLVRLASVADRHIAELKAQLGGSDR